MRRTRTRSKRLRSRSVISTSQKISNNVVVTDQAPEKQLHTASGSSSRCSSSSLRQTKGIKSSSQQTVDETQKTLYSNQPDSVNKDIHSVFNTAESYVDEKCHQSTKGLPPSNNSRQELIEGQSDFPTRRSPSEDDQSRPLNSSMKTLRRSHKEPAYSQPEERDTTSALLANDIPASVDVISSTFAESSPTHLLMSTSNHRESVKGDERFLKVRVCFFNFSNRISYYLFVVLY